MGPPYSGGTEGKEACDMGLRHSGGMIGGDGRWGAGKGRARQGAAKQVEYQAKAGCETILRMAFRGALCACSDLA